MCHLSGWCQGSVKITCITIALSLEICHLILLHIVSEWMQLHVFQPFLQTDTIIVTSVCFLGLQTLPKWSLEVKIWSIGCIYFYELILHENGRQTENGRVASLETLKSQKSVTRVEILARNLRWLVKLFDINLLFDFQSMQDNSSLNL